MPRTTGDPAVAAWTRARRDAARTGAAIEATIGERRERVKPAFASPPDWRDVWIYFLLTDRFNNPDRHTARARCGEGAGPDVEACRGRAARTRRDRCPAPALHAPARLRRKTWLARSPATDLNPS